MTQMQKYSAGIQLSPQCELNLAWGRLGSGVTHAHTLIHKVLALTPGCEQLRVKNYKGAQMVNDITPSSTGTDVARLDFKHTHT